MRQVFIYDTQDLSGPLHREDLNTSPAILIPHYDEDSSTLFLTGRVSTGAGFRQTLKYMYSETCI